MLRNDIGCFFYTIAIIQTALAVSFFFWREASVKFLNAQRNPTLVEPLQSHLSLSGFEP